MKNFQKNRRILIIWLWISFFLHVVAFSYFVEVAPRLGRKRSLKSVYYVDMVSLGGGRKGVSEGSSSKKKNSVESQKKQDLPYKSSMRELKKASEEVKNKPSMTYSKPVKKVKKSRKTKKSSKRKKRIIRKPQKTDFEKAFDKVLKESSGSSTTKGKKGNIVGFGVGDGSGEGMLGGFPFLYYVEIIRNRISSNWITGTLKERFEEGTVAVLSFRIERDGRVKDVKVEKSSTIRAFDISALRAIYNSSPFPPLPLSYPDDYLIVVIQFKLGRTL